MLSGYCKSGLRDLDLEDVLSSGNYCGNKSGRVNPIMSFRTEPSPDKSIIMKA